MKRIDQRVWTNFATIENGQVQFSMFNFNPGKLPPALETSFMSIVYQYQPAVNPKRPIGPAHS